jgi:hypothetical protein
VLLEKRCDRRLNTHPVNLDLAIQLTGPPVTQGELVDLERRLAIRLPEDYKRFLLAYNGGYPAHQAFDYDGDSSFAIQHFYPLASDDVFHVSLFRDAYGEEFEDLLEIGISSFGDPLCLAVGDAHFGSVWWYDHEHDPEEDPHLGLTKLAATFEEFVTGLTPI